MEQLLKEFVVEFQSPESVEESLKGIDEDIEKLRSNPNKIALAKDGIARIFRKLFPDTIVGIGSLVDEQGDQSITIPWANSLTKFQEALKAYQGPVGERVMIDELPGNEQFVQLIVPQLMIAFKDV